MAIMQHIINSMDHKLKSCNENRVKYTLMNLFDNVCNELATKANYSICIPILVGSDRECTHCLYPSEFDVITLFDNCELNNILMNFTHDLNSALSNNKTTNPSLVLDDFVLLHDRNYLFFFGWITSIRI